MGKKSKQKQKKKPAGSERRSGSVGLAALGVQVRRLNLLGPLYEKLKIRQKTVKDRPVDKVVDALIGILLGIKGIVEINLRLRSEVGVSRAFGRERCAEQSVVQETLNASTAGNVAELAEAVKTIFRRHSRAARHEVKRDGKRLLDLDLTGRPSGKKAECATPGYFAGERNRTGRQVGRVLATQYGEIVVDQLFAGKQGLAGGMPSLLLEAEAGLGLDAAERSETIIRMDGGGGTVANLNWLLERGYHVLGKDYSGNRAEKLAATVTEWIDDPRHSGRQIGEVTVPAPYLRPVTRLAVRCPKKGGGWAVGILVTTLSPREILLLAGQPVDGIGDESKVWGALVTLYDQRGGGVELSFKEGKQGLLINKRNKKRFAAQQMVMLLELLAFNLLVWARAWLQPHAPRLARLGLLRFLRDVLRTSGTIILTGRTKVVGLFFNRAAPYARDLVDSFAALFQSRHLVLGLAKI